MIIYYPVGKFNYHQNTSWMFNTNYNIQQFLPSRECIVCVFENVIAGYITFNQTDEYLTFNMIEVDPYYRNCGIATTMLTYLFKLVKNKTIIINGYEPDGEKYIKKIIDYFAKINGNVIQEFC